jgi:hypothetical protein
MRIPSRQLLPALALAAFLFLPAAAHAQDKVAVPDVFSYQLPAGWAKVDLPGSSYPTAIEAAAQNGQAKAQAMITANADTTVGDLGSWCIQALARNKAQLASLSARVGVLEPFVATGGFNGYRATIDLTARGRPIHYVMYFFEGGNSTKITFTCACSAPDAAHYAPLFEAAMKSFSPQ